MILFISELSILERTLNIKWLITLKLILYYENKNRDLLANIYTHLHNKSYHCIKLYFGIHFSSVEEK